MDGKKFTDNGFLAVINNPAPSSPIAVLNFEEYSDIKQLDKELKELKEKIQCVVASTHIEKNLVNIELPFIGEGETQSPGLSDYADGIDVMEFLLEQQQLDK